jgi:signal transduction histidine kinase
VAAAEAERGRWARELHDETLQGLIGVRMMLSAGLARDDAALRPAAQNADAHLAEELRRLRALIAELRPAALDDLGLGAALASLAQRQASIGGFQVATEIQLADGRRLPRDTEGAVYRIVQEALTNVIRHAGAAHVAVAVHQLAREVEIEVTDDGRGFDPESAVGFGLTGMRERALLAGGSLRVASARGGPTHIHARLPAV